MKTPKNKKY